jgi:Cu/Ag efflux protein CusF
MARGFLTTLTAFLLTATCLLARQEGDGPQKATLKQVDPEKKTVTLTVNGKERTFTVTSDTRIMAPGRRPLPDGLKSSALKPGTPVLFKAARQDGKDVLLGMMVGAGGPQDIRRARYKKVDPDKGIVTLTVDGKDRDFLVTDETHFLNLPGKTLGERLKGLQAGTPVLFKSDKKGDQEVLLGLGRPDGAGSQPQPPPKVDTSALKPLPELGKGKYHGFEGGLYLDGKNERPADHAALGLSLASKVQPLDGEGKPATDGKVVLLSIGMSNTTQEFSAFKRLADADENKDPRLVVVDGAQGGMSAGRIHDPDSESGQKFWKEVDARLQQAGVTRSQVQVAWIKQADPGPNQGFPQYAKTLQAELARIIGVMHERFPNLKLVYLSSRTYGGYARSRLNPEPYAYESGFSVKWLIEQQIKGDPALNANPAKGKVRAPWLSWGPYLWANGMKKNADGLFYEESDFAGDGTHPSESGRRKVAEQLLHFFKTDPTARLWFVKH